MGLTHDKQSYQRNQSLIPLVNIRNVDRAEYVRLGLCLELLRSENISVSEPESFLVDNETQNDIANKGMLIHAVTFLKSVAIQKNISQHGMPDQIHVAVDSRLFCICSVIDLLIEKSTALSAGTKEKRPEIPGEIRTEPELPSCGHRRHHGSQAPAGMAYQINLNFILLSRPENPPFFVENKVNDNFILELMVPSLGLCAPVEAVDKPLHLSSQGTRSDNPQQKFKRIHGLIFFSVQGQGEIGYARIRAVVCDKVLTFDVVRRVDVLPERYGERAAGQRIGSIRYFVRRNPGQFHAVRVIPVRARKNIVFQMKTEGPSILRETERN